MNDSQEYTSESYRFLRRKMEYVLTLLVEDATSTRAHELLASVPDEYRSMARDFLVDEAFLSGIRIRSLYVNGIRWI